MMVAKRVLLCLLLVCLLAATASAINFNVAIDPQQATTRISEAAEYTVLISHDAGTPERFELYSPDVEWDISTDILRPFTVEKGETKEVVMSVKPLYATPGFYAIAVHIRHSATGELLRKTIIIDVRPKDYVPGQYAPAVRLSPSVDPVDPREPAIVNIEIRNANPRDLDNVQVKVRSELIQAEIEVDLIGLEKKLLVLPIRLPADTPPQKDTLRVTAIVVDGEKVIPFNAEPVEFEIVEYGEIAENIGERQSFLKTDWDYTLTNTGNIIKAKEFKLKPSFFQSWFTSYEPLARKVETSDGTFDSWDIVLDVGESTVIRATTNYRPLLIILLIAAIAIGAYYLLRSPLVVRKSAVVIAAKEGGMSELKILIEVANRTTKPVKHVQVMDKVPHIAEVSRDFEVGTMRPVKIAHDEKKGTLIKWVIDELDSHEERVISYKIRSKLSILGSMRLPVAVTKCETSPGRTRKTKSNISQIGFGQ